jgi:hypothetical protein
MKRKKQVPYQRRDAPLAAIPATDVLAQFPLHHARCDADPIYRMLMFPNDVIDMDDGSNMRYIDVLLKNARALLEKMYGKYMRESVLIQHMFDLLDGQHDEHIKIFVMNFILAHEPSIARCLSDMYDTFAKEALFEGRRGPQQLFLWNQYFLKPVMGWHKNHHNNKYTIVMEMEHHVLQATREYIMGPFDAPRSEANKKKR